jgi:DNA-binding CsgD family transcriptional regulator
VWKDRHEMSVEEIARELNSTPDSIKHTLKRAMKKLRDGRADQLRDLMIARERESNHGLPKISYGDMT